MLRRVGIFVDIGNLYYCVGKRWEGRKLNYEEYLSVAQGESIRIRATAYGTQLADEAMTFISALRHFGYETKYQQPKISQNADGEKIRKADWDVGIAMDVVRMVGRLDTVILGTADPDMVPLVKYIQERGSVARIVACGISRELKDAADSYFEITEDMLVEIEHAVTTESS